MDKTRKARTYGRMDYLDDPQSSGVRTDSTLEWRRTKFDGYEVCCDGNVRSTRGVMKPYRTGKRCNQYETVQIGGKNIKVHRLVADAFLPERAGAIQVNHIDGNRLNNAVSNLERVTPSENVRHAYRVLGAPVLTKHWWGGGGHKGKTGSMHHASKPVRAILPDGSERLFPCVAAAAHSLNLRRESIGRVANGFYRTTKGYKFCWEQTA